MFPATDKEGGAWLMNVISFETDNDKSTVNLMNVISFETDHDKSTVNLGGLESRDLSIFTC